MPDSTPPAGEPVNPRLPWLETLAAACERVLARRHEVDPTDAASVMLFDDVGELLARIRAELREAGH